MVDRRKRRRILRDQFRELTPTQQDRLRWHREQGHEPLCSRYYFVIDVEMYAVYLDGWLVAMFRHLDEARTWTEQFSSVAWTIRTVRVAIESRHDVDVDAAGRT